MPKITANGIRIGYEVYGEGAPLVLIAGIGYDRWMWHRMIPHLAEQFQVIAFDNRGVGESDAPPGPYSAQLLAADTAALLDELGIERAMIYGHSMGGFIAQALVLERPDLVSHLILSATNFGGPNHIPITQEAMTVLSDTTSDPIERLKRGVLVSCAPAFAEREPGLVQAWLEYRLQHPIDPAAYQAQMAIGLGLLSAEASFEKKLAGMRCYTLILSGEHDKVVPPGNTELLAQAIPYARVSILPAAGHFYPLETPRAASRAILQFYALAR